MPTEKNLKKLTIHKLKKKTYNALAEKPVDELVMLTDVGGQVAEITEASADYVGEIVQYVGETNDTYTNGYFYKCVSDGAETPTYSWAAVQVQEGGAGGNVSPDFNEPIKLTLESSYLNLVDVLSVTTRERITGNHENELKARSFIGQKGLYLNFFLHPLEDNKSYIGNKNYRWKSVATTMLNNGEPLNVPTVGGTLARLEDLQGIGGGASLPDQTGNAGKFLMTDGSTASWGGDDLIKNTAKESYRNSTIRIGLPAPSSIDFASSYISVTGSQGACSSGAVAIGSVAKAANSNSIAIGRYAQTTGERSIILDASGSSNNKNTEADVFAVGNGNGLFVMMDANGNVPRERLKNLVEVLPTADNGYTTVKNFGNNYIEASGIYEFGALGANEEVVDVIPLPEGVQFAEGQMYWASAHVTTEDSNANAVVAHITSRTATALTIVYKNLGTTEVENLLICWEVRGVVAPK